MILNMGPPVMEAEMRVLWTKAMREQLRKAYQQAVDNNKEEFTFEGNQYDTFYAKYLLEYMDMKMGV